MYFGSYLDGKPTAWSWRVGEIWGGFWCLTNCSAECPTEGKADSQSGATEPLMPPRWAASCRPPRVCLLTFAPTCIGHNPVLLCLPLCMENMTLQTRASWTMKLDLGRRSLKPEIIPSAPELQCDDPVSVSSPMCLQEIKHLSQAVLVYCLSKSGSESMCLPETDVLPSNNAWRVEDTQHSKYAPLHSGPNETWFNTDLSLNQLIICF